MLVQTLHSNSVVSTFVLLVDTSSEAERNAADELSGIEGVYF